MKRHGRALRRLYITLGPPLVVLVLFPWPTPRRVLVALVWAVVAGLILAPRMDRAAVRIVSHRNWRTGRVTYRPQRRR